MKFKDLKVGERCQGPGIDLCEKIIPVRFDGEMKNVRNLDKGGLGYINDDCEVFKVDS